MRGNVNIENKHKYTLHVTYNQLHRYKNVLICPATLQQCLDSAIKSQSCMVKLTKNQKRKGSYIKMYSVEVERTATLY